MKEEQKYFGKDLNNENIAPQIRWIGINPRKHHERHDAKEGDTFRIRISCAWLSLEFCCAMFLDCFCG